MAVALEQENRARVEEMRSRVVEAEAQVPLAIADALRKGNFGVMDYARYQNMQSDTGMRRALASGSPGPAGPAGGGTGGGA